MIAIPLKDQNGNQFWYNSTDDIIDNIETIESSATDDLFKSVPIDLEASVISDALIDEAFHSSVIEGAFSTKKRTKNMIEKNLKPANKSEFMMMKILSYLYTRYSQKILQKKIMLWISIGQIVYMFIIQKLMK